MKKPAISVIVVLLALQAGLSAQTADTADTADPYAFCCGKYPIGMFLRARTAKTLPQGRLALCLKTVYFGADKVRNAAGGYDSIIGENEKTTNALVARYGIIDNHQVGTCIPYVWNNFSTGGVDTDSDGLANILVFYKWRILEETVTIPAVAVDAGYYFANGNTSRKLGNDDYAWRIGAIASKALPAFSVHLEALQVFTEGRSADRFEGNAAVVLGPEWGVQPGLEYNYTYKESSGLSHDLVPGVAFKLPAGFCIKAAAIINLDTTMKYKDDLGFVVKISRCF